MAILSVSGRLDAVTAPQFSQTIAEQMSAGYHRLVIDLNSVDFLSSAGIKAVLLGVQHARRQGGDLRIANAQGQVKHLLNLAGVDSVIKFYSGVVAATASYFPGPLT